MGRPAGSEAEKKNFESYAVAMQLLTRNSETDRARRFLEKAVVERNDADLAPDALFLRILNARDQKDAGKWFGILAKRFPKHPNLVAAQHLLDAIQRGDVGTEITESGLEPGSFVDFGIVLGVTSHENQRTQILSAELTRLQWERGEGEIEGGSEVEYPVTDVSPDQIVDYLNWLNARSNRWLYRLPTLEEWQLLFSATTESPDFQLSYHAWTASNSCEKLQKSALKLPSRGELYDLLGNAAEWCVEDSDTEHPRWVLCGGSFESDSSAVRGGLVEERDMNRGYHDAGFRLVRELRHDE